MNRSDERYVIIHGHFYQPPRENPWTEAIERQPSAAPHHDWNERVTAECYHPNAFSRILSPYQERIAEIVNNYTSISFNFGPTLLSWLERHAPETYLRVLAADRQSAERFSGHGNAIAQAYNHIILPLANERDRLTQIRWGIADFRHRFGRRPESLWLPETAVDHATLQALCDHGLRFLILSPYQAERVRPLDGGEWKEVANGEIDTSRPYRCFVDSEGGGSRRFIDIFFYHGEMSRGVAFEHLLRDAGRLADRIESGFAAEDQRPGLVFLATDGESYGHHEPFGDMGLAYFLRVEAPRRGLAVTNPGEFLDRYPPQDEVLLKPGPDGEGTSWSCVHGVGRWYRNCGCNTGGHPEWNQEWRGPLRAAFDFLRDRLAAFFEQQGAAVFRDPWAARDAYIGVILNRDQQTVDRFFAEHASGPIDEHERVRALKLLEMQRHALLMYTSCGWFFDDLSGIETVQVIQYAARALQVAQSLGSEDIEAGFLARLKKAKSNLPEFGDGARIYERLVKPAVVTFPKVVGHYAMRSAFEPFEGNRKIYHYTIRLAESERVRDTADGGAVGLVEIQSGVTFEVGRYAYWLDSVEQSEEMACRVQRVSPTTTLADLLSGEQEVGRAVASQSRGNEPEGRFTILDMLPEDREQIMQILLKRQTTGIAALFSKIYRRHGALMRQLRRIGLQLPAELKVPAETVLSERLHRLIAQQEVGSLLQSQDEALRVVEEARDLGLALDTRREAVLFQRRAEQILHGLTESGDLAGARELREILEFARRLGVDLQEGRIQELLFAVLRARVVACLDELERLQGSESTYEFVTEILHLAHLFHFDIRSYQSRLEPYEKRLNEDPANWP